MLEGHTVFVLRATNLVLMVQRWVVPQDWYNLQKRIRDLDEREKAKITTWFIEQRKKGVACPNIDEDVLESIKNRRPLRVGERMDMLLKFLAKGSNVGDELDIPRQITLPEAPMLLAHSESIKLSEVLGLVESLKKGGLDRVSATRQQSTRYTVYKVTHKGFARIEEMETKTDSSQGFVAMWFNDEVKGIFENGIEPAIKEAGYKAMRIDQKPDVVNKLDDEIIAEIRRSRFLVADFTHGKDGARGSVYFEAGFALGLGIPIFYTCREDMVEGLHFDTRQYPHITWKKDDEDSYKKFCKELKSRIRAHPQLGDGPEKK